jgi:hypothetical protein
MIGFRSEIPRTPSFLAGVIATEVAGDRIEPGAELGLWLELRAVDVEFDESLFQNVGGFSLVLNVAIDEPKKGALVPFHQLLESVIITTLESPQ